MGYVITYALLQVVFNPRIRFKVPVGPIRADSVVEAISGGVAAKDIRE